MMYYNGLIKLNQREKMILVVIASWLMSLWDNHHFCDYAIDKRVNCNSYKNDEHPIGERERSGEGAIERERERGRVSQITDGKLNWAHSSLRL